MTLRPTEEHLERYRRADKVSFNNGLGRKQRKYSDNVETESRRKMVEMTPKKFDRIANELFGDALKSHGFTSKESRYCTYYRKVSDEIFHVILPDLGTRSVWYDVKVFPTSPLIEPRFEELFPDDLGIPTDWFSYLHPVSGVGPDQEAFSCETEEDLRRSFENKVRPALIQKALPYLGRIETLSDLVPIIRNDGYLALALYHTGEVEKALLLLAQERERLSQLNSDDETVLVEIEHIDKLLASQ